MKPDAGANLGHELRDSTTGCKCSNQCLNRYTTHSSWLIVQGKVAKHTLHLCTFIPRMNCLCTLVYNKLQIWLQFSYIYMKVAIATLLGFCKSKINIESWYKCRLPGTNLSPNDEILNGFWFVLFLELYVLLCFFSSKCNFLLKSFYSELFCTISVSYSPTPTDQNKSSVSM